MPKEIVEVTWIDIITRSEWLSKKKRKKTKGAKVKSYGIIESYGKKYLKLNHSVSGKDADLTVIPVGNVKKIKRLRRRYEV